MDDPTGGWYTRTVTDTGNAIRKTLASHPDTGDPVFRQMLRTFADELNADVASILASIEQDARLAQIAEAKRVAKLPKLTAADRARIAERRAARADRLKDIRRMG